MNLTIEETNRKLEGKKVSKVSLSSNVWDIYREGWDDFLVIDFEDGTRVCINGGEERSRISVSFYDKEIMDWSRESSRITCGSPG